jgi:hypothetical protein
MPRRCPSNIELSASEREWLESRARRYTLPYRDVVRAKIILLAADGHSNKEIARELHLPCPIVGKWRQRYYREGPLGLQDRPRGGRYSDFPPQVVCEVKTLACHLPDELGLPFSRLSLRDLRQEVIKRGLAAQTSGTTIWCWLSRDAIRPWAHRSWIFPRDPDFADKAGRALDLYARVWQEAPLGEGEYVLSADEMAGLQLRSRLHPTRFPQPGKPMWVEHEDQRMDTLAYLAA